MPDGEAPPEGWPTVIFLHTYGKAAAISPKNGCCSAKWAWRTSRSTARRCRKTASAGRITATSTHTAIQRTLQQLAPQLKLNTQRIYLSARGEAHCTPPT